MQEGARCVDKTEGTMVRNSWSQKVKKSFRYNFKDTSERVKGFKSQDLFQLKLWFYLMKFSVRCVVLVDISFLTELWILANSSPDFSPFLECAHVWVCREPLQHRFLHCGRHCHFDPCRHINNKYRSVGEFLYSEVELSLRSKSENMSSSVSLQENWNFITLCVPESDQLVLRGLVGFNNSSTRRSRLCSASCSSTSFLQNSLIIKYYH